MARFLTNCSRITSKAISDMETLISLVIFGVVYFLIYVVKNMIPKCQGTVPVNDMGEVFQQTDMPEPEIVAPVVTKTVRENSRKRPLLYGEGEAAGNKEHRSTSDTAVKSESPKGKRSCIGNRSEAKRAFIYSEIFKRKYE